MIKKQVHAGIYVRVSTKEQNTDAQEAQLRLYAERRGWVVFRVYADKGVSGARASRPALDVLVGDCKRRKVDVVLVWKFDRFARSLKHLLDAMEFFKSLKVDFVSCTEGIDTSIPSGEMIFHVLGAIAQFERCLIGERVRAGLAEAKRNGVILGRPPKKKLSEEEVNRIKSEHAQRKLSLRKLAAKHGTSLWAVYRAVSENHVGV